jgi:hypothetical protein
MKTKMTKLKLLLAAVMLVAVNLVSLGHSSAASLTNTYVKLNRMKSGTATSFRLQFKAVSSQTANVTIDFNGTDVGAAQWTNATPGGLVNATQTVTTAACATDTGDTALPGGSLTAAGSGSVITISSVGATTSGTTYCADLTSASAVTTPTAGHEGEYHPAITIGTDSTNVAVRVVANDQVVVNATVPPSFNFAISGCASNIDNFTASLSAGSVGATAGCDVTINTNAKTGWLAWAHDSNTGLQSTAASTTIASKTPGTNVTLTAGPVTPTYIFSVSSLTQGSGAGVTTTATPYGDGSNNAAGANQGSGLDGTIRLIASSTGTANAAAFHVKSYAAINATTPAATDYTDTITIIGAGSF